MIPFLDLRAVNDRHRAAIDHAIASVLDSGQTILGPQTSAFETEFAQTYVFPVEEVSNIIVIATQGKDRLRKQEVIRRARRLEDERKVQFPLERYAHTYVLEKMIRRGLGRSLVEHLESENSVLVTTFFMPAVAADRLGYPHIYCIVTDSDIHRVWAPIDPVNTRITYLVPSQRTRRRHRAVSRGDDAPDPPPSAARDPGGGHPRFRV